MPTAGHRQRIKMTASDTRKEMNRHAELISWRSRFGWNSISKERIRATTKRKERQMNQHRKQPTRRSNADCRKTFCFCYLLIPTVGYMKQQVVECWRRVVRVFPLTEDCESGIHDGCRGDCARHQSRVKIKTLGTNFTYSSVSNQSSVFRINLLNVFNDICRKETWKRTFPYLFLSLFTSIQPVVRTQHRITAVAMAFVRTRDVSFIGFIEDI